MGHSISLEAGRLCHRQEPVWITKTGLILEVALPPRYQPLGDTLGRLAVARVRPFVVHLDAQPHGCWGHSRRHALQGHLISSSLPPRHSATATPTERPLPLSPKSSSDILHTDLPLCQGLQANPSALQCRNPRCAGELGLYSRRTGGNRTHVIRCRYTTSPDLLGCFH